MIDNKKIITYYISIFFLVVISSYFMLNKLVIETLKKDPVYEDDIIIINLESNYENYTFNFRGDEFLRKIQKFSEKSSVVYISRAGKHIVEIKIPNADFEMISKFKNIINDSIILYNKDFNNCIENLQICNNYYLKDEIINYFQFKYNTNIEKRMIQLSCLLSSELKNCKEEMIYLIKDHFEPIKVGYNFIENKNQNQNQKEKNKDKIFLLTNSIMLIFISAFFIISSPILFILAKKRL